MSGLSIELGINSQQQVVTGGGGGGSTWNPADESAGITLSNGNLTAAGASNVSLCGARSTVSKTTGKWYFEVHIDAIDTTASQVVGLADAVQSLTVAGGSNTDNAILLCTATQQALYYNGYVNNNATASAVGTVIQFAVDCDNKKVWANANNSATWLGTANATAAQVAAGTNGVVVAFTTFYQFIQLHTATMTLNSTAASQAYTPPAGFTAWG